MSREDVRKLLGGYATGTLTPEEQEALFAAALEDQELFNALAKEQALRDLLRDPAARAEALAAIDTPARRGFWRWPVAAGLAASCAALVLVAVMWRTARVEPVPVPQAIIARNEPPRAEAPAILKAPEPSAVVAQSQPAKKAVHETKSIARTPAATETVTVAPVPVPPAVPAPAPAVVTDALQSKADAIQSKAEAPLAPPPASTDARAIFYGIYGNALLPQQNQPLAAPFARQQQSAPQIQTRAATGVAQMGANAINFSPLGVRVTLLRGDQETPVATLLDPAESVRLRITPNQDGFLYVAVPDALSWKMLVSGPVKRLVAFDTAPIIFETSGRKQLYVMLSRTQQNPPPESLARLSRANLVQNIAAPERATYVVSPNPAQQIVQPLTLSYR